MLVQLQEHVLLVSTRNGFVANLSARDAADVCRPSFNSIDVKSDGTRRELESTAHSTSLQFRIVKDTRSEQ